MKIPAKELLEKYNRPVPRYTSYPTANRFEEGFEAAQAVQLIESSNADQPHHLSFYVHVPFCERICFYCGCHSLKTSRKEVMEAYAAALLNEIELVTSRIDPARRIAQIHFGGGTPHSLPAEALESIVKALTERFSLTSDAEIAIECHPGTLTKTYAERLLGIGFNRFSLGIQDFNEEVLKTVNRLPSSLPPEEWMDFFRSHSTPVSVNMDFMYGLPGQTVASFSETIRKAVALGPDRLVTFSYAHVPWLKKHQEILQKAGLPDEDAKTAMFLASAEILAQNGYRAIGLDHYVKTSDELYLAYQEGLLHRNFQGYCTRKTTGQVYAFGVSGISQLHRAYIQNTKEVDQYIASLNAGVLPVEKGFVLGSDEVLLREVITQIMCNGRLDTVAFCEKHGLSASEFRTLTKVSEDALTEMATDGLIEWDGIRLNVTPEGALFVRNVAAAFDPAYHPQANQFSKSL